MVLLLNILPILGAHISLPRNYNLKKKTEKTKEKAGSTRFNLPNIVCFGNGVNTCVTIAAAIDT